VIWELATGGGASGDPWIEDEGLEVGGVERPPSVPDDVASASALCAKDVGGGVEENEGPNTSSIDWALSLECGKALSVAGGDLR